MNGIFFDMDPDGTTLVASDSHKLICYTADGVQVDAKASFILHKKAAAVLRSIVDKDADDVEIVFDQSTVVFTFGSTMMVCRLVVGKYPKYRDVIPQNNSNVLKIDREQLLGTIRRVSVCANKASNHIKFDLKEGQLEITAQDLGFALAAYEKIACDYNGDDLSIGFKSNFLSEILANMSCETVVMKFADARRAALIVPSEEEADSERICGILMPIMVS
jgi:DNA polymerase-3 subunit beta